MRSEALRAALVTGVVVIHRGYSNGWFIFYITFHLVITHGYNKSPP